MEARRKNPPESSLLVQDTSHEHLDAGAYEPVRLVLRQPTVYDSLAWLKSNQYVFKEADGYE